MQTEIIETFIDEAEHVNITMPMYNLIEYSDNYFDTSGRLWQFKRDEIIGNITLTNNNSSSFKYKSNLVGNTDADEANRKKEGVKIAVPLKNFSNFWRSLEMPLINCKVEFSLRWNENCILSIGATATAFTITDTKLYVPVVTLKTEDNVKLSKLLNEGFKRSVYWNEYKVIPEDRYNANSNIRKLIDPSWQGINRLFFLAYLNDLTSAANSHRKHFLPRTKIENYNIEIDGRNFYDQSHYTTGCLLNLAYFNNNYKLIAADLSKQKVLDADSRAIQQIIFSGEKNKSGSSNLLYL